MKPNEVKALEDAEDKLENRSPNNAETEDTDEYNGRSRDDGVGVLSEDGASSDVGIRGEDDNEDTVRNERICYEAVSWRDYQHGPAKRWDQRPWESFRKARNGA